jgi:hypothetical protein
MKRCEKVVSVVHVSSICPGQLFHVYVDSKAQKGIGFLGPKKSGEETKILKDSQIATDLGR